MESPRLSRSAVRVQRALDVAGIELQVREMADSTRTAGEAANAIGCEIGQIAKSLVFRGAESGYPILIIASGANRVDVSKAGDAVGEALAKADADFVHEHTGFAIGGVPPTGHANPIPTYIDRDLMQFREIWAAAGTPRAVSSLTPSQLVELTRATVIAVV